MSEEKAKGLLMQPVLMIIFVLEALWCALTCTCDYSASSPRFISFIIDVRKLWLVSFLTVVCSFFPHSLSSRSETALIFLLGVLKNALQLHRLLSHVLFTVSLLQAALKTWWTLYLVAQMLTCPDVVSDCIANGTVSATFNNVHKVMNSFTLEDKCQ